MKIGIFDSGLGGLFTAKKLIKELPQYDYVYLGDTKRLPYGTRSVDTVYEFLTEALDFLYRQDCQLVIVACNTASTEGIDRVKREFLSRWWPDRKILGIVIPTVEKVSERKDLKRVGVLATPGTVNTGKYPKEFAKANKKMKIFQQAAPLLVPLIENDGIKYVNPVLKEYLAPLVRQKIDALILACTHYPILIKKIKKIIGKKTIIFSQDELIAQKLREYLAERPELERKLSKHGRREFLVTDMTKNFQKHAKKWFGAGIGLKLTHI